MSVPSTPDLCKACGRSLQDRKHRGRPRRYCNATCRSAARRQRVAATADPTQQRFAQTVRAALEQSGRSLRSLAAELEEAGFYISPGALSQWRNGQTAPTQPRTHTTDCSRWNA